MSYEWINREKVTKFIETYNKLKEVKSSGSLKKLIIEIINRTSILEYYVTSDVNKSEDIYSINKIVEEAERFQRFHKDASAAVSVLPDSDVPVGTVTQKIYNASLAYSTLSI